MRIQKQDYFIDPNPTRTDYPVLTDADLKALNPAPAETPAPATASSALPSITELELTALRGVDVAEAAADPINKFNAARAGIKLCAWVARKLR